MRTVTRPLRSDEARRAYALIRLADGTCTIEEWLEFAQGTAHPDTPGFEAGVITAHRPPGPLTGLFAYMTSVARPARQLLIVHHFVAFDPFGHGRTAKALLAAMDDIARRLERQAIRLELPPSYLKSGSLTTDILPHVLISSGYCPAGLNAVKPLVTPGRP